MQYLINAKQFIFFRVLAQVLFHTSKEGYLPFHSIAKQLQLVLFGQFSELLKIDYKKQFFLKIGTKRAAKSDL